MSNVTVQLFWEDSAIAGIDDCNTTDLTVASFNGTTWTDEGQSAIVCGNTGSITSNGVSTFSYFTLGSKTGADPEPVELLYFYAKLDGERVEIEWATKSEIDNDYFTLQRSVDGIDFENVTDITGGGNSDQILYYSAVDEEPYSGFSYYRLKQTAYDGTVSYLLIDSVNCLISAVSTIVVYPIPTSQKFLVDIRGDRDQEVLVVVHDLLGKEYYSETITLNSNKQTLTINASDKLDAGVYIITVTSENELYRKEVVVL